MSGASHVICIDMNKQVKDKAAVDFSKTFYRHIFEYNLSICEAFNTAQSVIAERYSDLEAKKFMILKNEDHKSEECKIKTDTVPEGTP